LRSVLEERIRLWLDDAESSVEYAEEVEGRWAVRMRQQTRDATTVWFEAHVIPQPAVAAEAHRQALVRNGAGWRCFFALDDEGAIVLRGRVAAAHVTLDELDLVLGEIYDTIEVAFRPMVRAGFPGREKSG
jgi:hypothetical protein